MPHISLTEGLPGIRGPMVFSPETTKPLCDLVQVLLTGPHTLTTVTWMAWPRGNHAIRKSIAKSANRHRSWGM
jgi:hypothetical protein